jgi:hypothetical protein
MQFEKGLKKISIKIQTARDTRLALDGSIQNAAFYAQATCQRKPAHTGFGGNPHGPEGSSSIKCYK